MDRFQACLDFVWDPENDGQPFHVTPKDPGRATAWGVTLSTYSAWRKLHKQPDPTPADLQRADKDELAAIYRTFFWNALRCDELPIGVDLCVFDFGVGSAPGRSAAFLQQQLGLATDGVIGPATLQAANDADPEQLIDALTVRDVAFYKGLKTFPIFGRGWTKRAERRRVLAHRMRLIA